MYLSLVSSILIKFWKIDFSSCIWMSPLLFSTLQQPPAGHWGSVHEKHTGHVYLLSTATLQPALAGCWGFAHGTRCWRGRLLKHAGYHPADCVCSAGCLMETRWRRRSLQSVGRLQVAGSCVLLRVRRGMHTGAVDHDTVWASILQLGGSMWEVDWHWRLLPVHSVGHQAARRRLPAVWGWYEGSWLVWQSASYTYGGSSMQLSPYHPRQSPARPLCIWADYCSLLPTLQSSVLSTSRTSPSPKTT